MDMPTPRRQVFASADTAYGIGCGAFTAIMLLQLTQIRQSPPFRSGGEISAGNEAGAQHVPRCGARYAAAVGPSYFRFGAGFQGRRHLFKGPAAEWEKTLIAALPHTSYEFEPGTHAALSNIDDSVLALALSRAAHRPYSEYLKQRILSPLGMTHTDFSAAGRNSRPGAPCSTPPLATWRGLPPLKCSRSRRSPFPQGPGGKLPAALGHQFHRRSQSE